MADAPEKESSDDNLPALEGEAGGGNKKKKLILILVPLILLLGGGAGLYFTGMLDSLLGKKPATEEAAKEGEEKTEEHGEEKAEKKGEHAEAEGEKKEGEGGGEHGEGGKGGPAFLKVPDLIVNLAGDGGQPRYLRLSVQLELANEADMKAVETVLPRVIDQFQTYLRELRISDLQGSKGMYRLQMELLSRVNAAASPTEVKDVLFQEILIQ